SQADRSPPPCRRNGKDFSSTGRFAEAALPDSETSAHPDGDRGAGVIVVLDLIRHTTIADLRDIGQIVDVQGEVDPGSYLIGEPEVHQLALHPVEVPSKVRRSITREEGARVIDE